MPIHLPPSFLIGGDAVNKKMLESMYSELGSVSALARAMGVSYSTMRYRLTRYGIPIRRSGYRSPKTIRHYAEDHHNWKGGIIKHDGYILEYCPSHPCSVPYKGYMPQHRLVMERLLGRYLGNNEIIHHINGDKADNRPENLKITDISEHIKHHKATAKRDKLGRFTA